MKNISFLRGLLVFSLVLNGFLAGMLLSGPPHRMHDQRPSPVERMAAAIHVLKPDDQATVRHIMDKYRPAFEKRAGMMRQKIDRINAVLTAPTLDEKALQAALEQDTAHDVMKENMKNLLTETAKALPDDARIRLFTEMAPGPFPPEKHRMPGDKPRH